MPRIEMEYGDEVIEDFSKPGVLPKYRAASTVASRVLARVVDQCQPEKRIVDICKFADALIVSELNKTVKPTPAAEVNEETREEDEMKGIAFPTCLSVNNIAGHFSPLSDDATKLAAGDIVKIDLGVHVGGFAAVLAHTVVVGGAQEVTDRRADVIAAAYMAFQAVGRSLRPGVKNTELSEVIDRVAKAYGVNAVEGVLSHSLHRFVIDGAKVIMNKPTTDQRAEEVEVEALDAWAVDIVMSSGEGKTKDLGNMRTTVFKRSADQQYLLKLKASRATLAEIQSKFPAFPFSLRALSDEKRAKLGVAEMVSHGLLETYPVLHERQGETIAQFKGTFLVGPKVTAMLSGPAAPPQRVKSEKSEAVMAGDATIRAALGRQLVSVDELASSLSAKKKKKAAPKHKKKAAASTEAAAASDAAPASAAAPASEHPQPAAPMQQ
eukprot:m51a1_g5946 putative proliferation-associated protein 2g4-like (437) ;mRNA; f:125753-127898